MVGLSYALYGIGTVFISSKLHYSLYYILLIIGNFILIVFTLILNFYVMFANCYKLRTRDNIVPVHHIAEEHYERYFNQSEEYRR